MQKIIWNHWRNNVDFVGGDFNMTALSTVGDVFSDPEFSAPGNSFLWRLGALEEQNRECTGFLIMPKRPYEWRVDSHGCYKFDNAALGFGPRDQSAHLMTILLIVPLFPCPSASQQRHNPLYHRPFCHHPKTLPLFATSPESPVCRW